MSTFKVVDSNTVITYSELRTAFVDWIKGVAANLNMDNVPAPFKTPYSEDTPHVNLGWTTATLTNNKGIGAVTPEQIVLDVDNFMTARGINTKSNTPITTKGILQFWNCAAVFCAARLTRAVSSMTSETPLIYRKGAVTYTDPGITDNNSYITNTDVTSALTGLANTIKNYSKAVAMIYSYSAHCCCSSSSSSSSCSSSVFIGYMKLPN